MNETQTAAKKTNGQPGAAMVPSRPRYGGRKPGSPNKRTRQAIEICEAYDFHPVATLIAVITTGRLPNSDGTFAEVDTAGRMDALKALCPYVMPRLQATQVTGKDDGPVAVANFDVAQLMANPDAVKAAQDLALMLVGADRPAPGQRVLPPGDREWTPEK